LTDSGQAAGDLERGQADKDRIVALLGEEWSVIAELATSLDADGWSAPALPGWDVHDVLAHLVGTERMLDGVALPSAGVAGVAGDGGDHVRNDIGKANEAWVISLRDRSHAELLADFRAITAKRLASLSELSTEEFNKPSWTPAGDGTYGRWMEIRVFDCWMHEQDIRAATGRPGHEEGPAAEQSLAEVIGALGYIIGKRGRAPDGSSVLIRLTGPIERDVRVVTSGRAKVVDAFDGEPTATISLSSSLFLRLAGGRQDPEGALGEVKLGGDIGLARQLATNLAFTI
jgi:uncharacterized protein (TIGR03083 family)